MKHLVLTGVVTFALALSGCGKSNNGSGGSSVSPESGPVTGKVTLISFAAPTCTPCRAELNSLSKSLSSDPALKGKVAAILYVTEGEDPGSPADDSTSRSYGATVAPGFEVHSDTIDHAIYRKYVAGRYQLPVDVVLDKDQKVLRLFYTPAPTADTVATYLRSIVN